MLFLVLVWDMARSSGLQKDLHLWRAREAEEFGLSKSVVDWGLNEVENTNHEKTDNSGDLLPDEFGELLKTKLRLLSQLNRSNPPDKEIAPKLQASVPPSLVTLLTSWAVCEGRDVSSVVLHALEVGLHKLKTDGRIPEPALQSYRRVCQKRLLLSELN